jgi:hypothetical protein
MSTRIELEELEHAETLVGQLLTRIGHFKQWADKAGVAIGDGVEPLEDDVPVDQEERERLEGVLMAHLASLFRAHPSVRKFWFLYESYPVTLEGFELNLRARKEVFKKLRELLSKSLSHEESEWAARETFRTCLPKRPLYSLWLEQMTCPQCRLKGEVCFMVGVGSETMECPTCRLVIQLYGPNAMIWQTRGAGRTAGCDPFIDKGDVTREHRVGRALSAPWLAPVTQCDPKVYLDEESLRACLDQVVDRKD